MIKHVKPTRLPFCRWFAALALGGLALTAHSAEVPVPQGAQILEYQKTGNTYTWSPVGSTTPKGPGTVSFPATSTVSDVAPKVTSTGSLPYDHKGGSAAKVVVSTPVNTTKLAAGAASVAAAAAAGKIKPGNPWVVSGQIAGYMVGPFFAADLVDWGLYQISQSDSGPVADFLSGEQYPVSSGFAYSLGSSSVKYSSKSEACASYAGKPPDYYYFPSPAYYVASNDMCYISVVRIGGGFSYSAEVGRPVQRESDCPTGTPIVNGVCTPNAPPKFDSVPLTEFFERAINEKPWSAVHASVVAGVIQAGHNVFTDGTDGAISGPEYVPLTTSESSWPVNVLPGTTTLAPPGHTGPTDSGTQTTTISTTAQNTFRPGSSSTGGQSGSGAAGPSMTTSQKTETKTSITNNITNNTSSTVVTNTTTTDETPKEPEKDFCEKNPKALACAEADTPEQETPKGELNIGYEYVDIFGNGSCPSDSYLNTHGQSLKVWDWAATCQNVQSYFRPILIACCAFAAFVIVSAGAKE